MNNGDVIAERQVDIAGFQFHAKGKTYPIEAGVLHTTNYKDGAVSWRWEMALELKKSDVIPSNEPTAILWPDGSLFVGVEVLERHKEGGLTLFKIVPLVKLAG